MLAVYGASCLRHASKWRHLRIAWRRAGINLCSTWIDDKRIENEAHVTPLAFAGAWIQNAKELDQAAALVVYAELDDVLRGAIFEAGYVIGQGKPVILVGRNTGFSSWQYHPLVHTAVNTNAARTTLETWLGREPNAIVEASPGVSQDVVHSEVPGTVEPPTAA
jgi:hypothetical protein